MKMKMKQARWYMASGCLLAVTANIVSRYTELPDFLKGFILGLGIALEIWALIIYRREGRVCEKE
jgi:hypothetical protein